MSQYLAREASARQVEGAIIYFVNSKGEASALLPTGEITVGPSGFRIRTFRIERDVYGRTSRVNTPEHDVEVCGFWSIAAITWAARFLTLPTRFQQLQIERTA